MQRKQMTTNANTSDLTLHIKTVRRAFRIPIPLDNQIMGVMKAESLTYTDAIIVLLQRRLREYQEKHGVFYCQNCSGEYKKKQAHVVPVGFEEFIFCDDCFFSDKYKEFIRKIL